MYLLWSFTQTCVCERVLYIGLCSSSFAVSHAVLTHKHSLVSVCVTHMLTYKAMPSSYKPTTHTFSGFFRNWVLALQLCCSHITVLCCSCVRQHALWLWTHTYVHTSYCCQCSMCVYVWVCVCIAALWSVRNIQEYFWFSAKIPLQFFSPHWAQQFPALPCFTPRYPATVVLLWLISPAVML